MASPTINIMRDFIVPMGEKLRQDERFAEITNIVYDVIDDIAFSEMPCIDYYVEGPMEDIARGSGSYSLQTRRLTLKATFLIWVYDAHSRQRMDEALFHVGGLLMDFLREHTDFDPRTGIGLTKTPFMWQVVRPPAEAGYVGMHSITAEFELLSGTGK